MRTGSPRPLGEVAVTAQQLKAVQIRGNYTYGYARLALLSPVVSPIVVDVIKLQELELRLAAARALAAKKVYNLLAIVLFVASPLSPELAS
jgi:hypothetical protein